MAESMYDSVLREEADGDGQGDDVGFEAVTELLVVLVDCHPSMRTEREDLQGASCMQIVIDSLVKHMKRRIIASKRDEVGIVFYGSEHQNSELTTRESLTAFDHIYVQQALQTLTAKSIKDMENVGGSELWFSSRIGSCNSSSAPEDLKNALWTCSQMFSKRATTNVLKRVFIFTDDDLQSMQDNSSLRSGIISRVEDLLTRKISVDLFPIAPETSFSMNHLWKDALQLESQEDAEVVVSGAAWKVEQLTHALFQRAARKRALQSTRWKLLDGVTIAVQIFAMVARQSKPTHSYLEAQTNEEVLCETSAICQDTGAQLQSITKKFIEIRKEKIVMDAPEPARSVREGLTLLGFKSRDTLKDYHNLRSSYFVYPNEKEIPGSSSTFIALHFQMYQQSQIAIVKYQRGAHCRLAALVAQQEVLEEDESGGTKQVTPPGMNMVILPFADEIRTSEDCHDALVCSAADSDVMLAEAIIDHLTDEDFRSTDLPNPALQHYYSVLHALALGEAPDPGQLGLVDATADGVEDALGREKSGHATVVKAAVQRFKDTVFGPEASGMQGKPSSGVGKKRPASQVPGSGALQGWTVAKLKSYCSDNGLQASGKKADLVDIVAQHMTSKK